MDKQAFMTLLQNKLSGCSPADLEERLNFYSEMIDDRMEEGLSQEAAVAAVGSVEDIAAQILTELTPAKQEKKHRRQRTAGEILLLALGSPIWLSLGIAAAAVVLSVYVSAWAVVISLWAVFASCAACTLAGVAACIIFAIGGHVATGLSMLAGGFVCAGTAIFLFHSCNALTLGMIKLTKGLWCKTRWGKKEAVQ